VGEEGRRKSQAKQARQVSACERSPATIELAEGRKALRTKGYFAIRRPGAQRQPDGLAFSRIPRVKKIATALF